MSKPDSNTLAYLTRKLDLHERELAIREREADIEAARLELDREKYEWVKQQQSDRDQQIGGLHEMLAHIAEHVDDESDGIVSRNRGRA